MKMDVQKIYENFTNRELALLEFIKRFYFSIMKSKLMLKSIFENEVLKPLAEDIQEAIIKITVGHEISQKFPVSISYQKFFIKTLLDVVETYNSSFSDILIEVYTKLISSPIMDNICFCTYFLNEEIYITLQESNYFVEKATTGLKTWEASKYLSEWCVENSQIFNNKKILELGCGIGLLGLTVLKISQPEIFIFTDKSSIVLNILSKNIDINFENKPPPKFEICQLNWEDTEKASTLSPNIILGADVVFDPSTIPSLVNILKMLLMKNSIAYIALTLRNEDTLKVFITELGNSKLKYQILNVHKKYFIYDNTSKLILYKIYLEKHHA